MMMLWSVVLAGNLCEIDAEPKTTTTTTTTTTTATKTTTTKTTTTTTRTTGTYFRVSDLFEGKASLTSSVLRDRTALIMSRGVSRPCLARQLISMAARRR